MKTAKPDYVSNLSFGIVQIQLKKYSTIVFIPNENEIRSLEWTKHGGAMALWNEENSYTSSGNEAPRANSTSVKALESHRVNHFYLRRIRLNLELCLADRWEPMDPAGP